MNLQQWMYMIFMSSVSLSGVYMNCNLQNQEDVLPVCTDASRTGQTVYIDTSQVATDKLMNCFCSSELSGPLTYVLVSFTVQNNPNCEIQFFLGQTRYCGNAEGETYREDYDGRLGEIKFEKSLIGDSSACLKLQVPVQPDHEKTQENSTLEVACFKGEASDPGPSPPQAVTMHPDPHSTPRPGSSKPGNTAPPVKDNVNQAGNSTTGSGGCPVQNCPSCNCPACNCPACNCPPCNCAAQGENVVNENYTIGYSLSVLVGCSVGLFVAGCLIGVVVTLGVSYLRSKR